MGSPLLTTEDRHLIWERYREGLNPAEVAQATGRAYHHGGVADQEQWRHSPTRPDPIRVAAVVGGARGDLEGAASERDVDRDRQGDRSGDVDGVAGGGPQWWPGRVSGSLNTTARFGEFIYRPTTSTSTASKSGSSEILNVSVVHGLRLWSRQIRATVSLQIPNRFANERVVQ
jgi:hypothetical protein